MPIASTTAPTHGRRIYDVGGDAGLHSLGICALELDTNDVPCEILHAQSYIHDGGVDPTEGQTRETRKKVSGVARRTQARNRTLRKVYSALDTFLERELGIDLEPYVPGTATDPWQVRAMLATYRIDNDQLRDQMVSIAARHMARHRGHRNPYQGTDRLYDVSSESKHFTQLRTAAEEICGQKISDDSTLPEVISRLRTTHPDIRVRGTLELGDEADSPYTEGEVIAGMVIAARKGQNGKKPLYIEGLISQHRVQQSDYARELQKIGRVQGLDPQFIKRLIDKVFYQKSPRGSAAENVGFDSLPGQENKRRAWRGEQAFQRYRIAAQLGNARVANDEGRVVGGRLSPEQFRAAFDLLSQWAGHDDPTWDQLAEHIGLEPGQLLPPVSNLDDGENIATGPLVDDTHRTLSTAKVESIRDYWSKGTDRQRDALLHSILFSNTDTFVAEDDEDNLIASEIDTIIDGLSEKDRDEVDKIKIATGRAAYSLDSLNKLTEYMVSNAVDLTEARQKVFGVDLEWTPPAPPLTELTGNAAVDRSIKRFVQVLAELEKRYGPPRRVIIEHVRGGLSTAKSGYEMEKENNSRSAARLALARSMGLSGKVSPRDMRKVEIVQRQNGQCVYCGTTISLDSMDLDHIVPRAGLGSTNTRDNLVGTCRRCNGSKKSMLYSQWAPGCGIPGTDLESVTERVKAWSPTGTSYAEKKRSSALIKDVIRRLKRTTFDTEADTRSIESTSWMATEIRRRLEQHYRDLGEDTEVRVYRGQITSAARSTWVAGDNRDNAVSVNNSVTMLGGRTGKNRYDRRHHALDAAVIATMRHSAAEVLVQRDQLRADARLGIDQQRSGDPTLPGGDVAPRWSDHNGKDPRQSASFARWKRDMRALIPLLDDALRADQIPVTRSLRLRRSVGRVHEDTVRPFLHKNLGDAWSPAEIVRIADHRVWTAMTRLDDFTWKKGLPSDPRREITIQGSVLCSRDAVDIKGYIAKNGITGGEKALAVRGGYVEVGAAIHHYRLFRTTRPGKSTVFKQDVIAADISRYAKFSNNPHPLTMDLPAHTVSHRALSSIAPSSPTGVCNATGDTEYLGWVVSGDEIYIPSEIMHDSEKVTSEGVRVLQKLLEEPLCKWIVAGHSNARFSLKLAEISSEKIDNVLGGVDDKSAKAVRALVGGTWPVSVNTLAHWPGVQIIRRNILGEIIPPSRGMYAVASWTLGPEA